MLLRWAWLCILGTLQATVAIPSADEPRILEIGLKDDGQIINDRKRFEVNLAKTDENSSYYKQLSNPTNDSLLQLQIARDDLRLTDNLPSRHVEVRVVYTSIIPLALSYDLDSMQAAQLQNQSWYWLPPANNLSLSIFIDVAPKQIGLSYLRFWVREARNLGFSEPKAFVLNSSSWTTQYYFDSLLNTPWKFELLGFPVIVLRGQGVVQLVFRIVVVSMVTIFTFTMGCELDPGLLKAYFRRPIGPAIGFCCQFIIMPLISLAIAKLVPIKQEFGFGLLTIGCSPGGGASNAWSLMLGGDINLSILMTFISSFSALFMMPLLLFAFGRFFIDVNRVRIPYGNICLQLLQIAIPALFGLGLRCWKPEIAKRFTKITRPMFVFFILFFLTFGIYANLSIFRLIGSYPIVMPTGALLPWIGFALAALVAFILHQPRPIIITIALETGIQNIGAAVLVLLYSMPQPEGDLGAVMPITVSLFTPVPLYFILLGVTIKRRCCRKKAPPSEIHEVEPMNAPGKDLAAENDKKETFDVLFPEEPNGTKHFHDSRL
ncbi:ileal sodium/bile acid cotransporter [Clonorchis sinensis]|uniref:Ileal sodium/bile acid cotransporter n=1 Tax=Clonorchis sinensis TaxID=79923 RepID=G7YWS9_CLOSI|nr:ileal sodium/bile acid cotransporter [Clonorchis sinensis]